MLPLVLLPGLNNTHAVFDGVRAALPPEVPVLAPDNPLETTVEAAAAWHLARLPERFWLTGFSFGGYVALAMLEAAPERIAGLALVCSTPLADSDEQRAKRAQGIELARQGRYVSMITSQGAGAFHPDSLRDEALLARRRAMVEDYGAERFIAHTTAVMQRPDRSRLLDGRLPLAVIGGSDDGIFPPPVVAAWADRLPHAWRATIARAGHLAPMERPAELARLLTDWIASRGG